MNNYTPTPIQRVIVMKLIKKLIGFMAPTFYHGSKRRTMAFDLYDQVKDFERELQRCVPMVELKDHSGDMWSALQSRELPKWLIDALYSTLTYDPAKIARCSTLQEAKAPKAVPTKVVPSPVDIAHLFDRPSLPTVLSQNVSSFIVVASEFRERRFFDYKNDTVYKNEVETNCYATVSFRNERGNLQVLAPSWVPEDTRPLIPITSDMGIALAHLEGLKVQFKVDQQAVHCVDPRKVYEVNGSCIRNDDGNRQWVAIEDLAGFVGSYSDDQDS